MKGVKNTPVSILPALEALHRPSARVAQKFLFRSFGQNARPKSVHGWHGRAGPEKSDSNLPGVRHGGKEHNFGHFARGDRGSSSIRSNDRLARGRSGVGQRAEASPLHRRIFYRTPLFDPSPLVLDL